MTCEHSGGVLFTAYSSRLYLIAVLSLCLCMETEIILLASYFSVPYSKFINVKLFSVGGREKERIRLLTSLLNKKGGEFCTRLALIASVSLKTCALHLCPPYVIFKAALQGGRHCFIK